MPKFCEMAPSSSIHGRELTELTSAPARWFPTVDRRCLQLSVSTEAKRIKQRLQRIARQWRGREGWTNRMGRSWTLPRRRTGSAAAASARRLSSAGSLPAATNAKEIVAWDIRSGRAKGDADLNRSSSPKEEKNLTDGWRRTVRRPLEAW